MTVVTKNQNLGWLKTTSINALTFLGARGQNQSDVLSGRKAFLAPSASGTQDNPGLMAAELQCLPLSPGGSVLCMAHTSFIFSHGDTYLQLRIFQDEFGIFRDDLNFKFFLFLIKYIGMVLVNKVM